MQKFATLVHTLQESEENNVLRFATQVEKYSQHIPGTIS